MSIKLIWAIPCERAILEDKSEVISLIGTLEKFNLSMTRAQIEEGVSKTSMEIRLRHYLVSRWSRDGDEDPKSIEVGVSLAGPSGKEVSSIKSLPVKFHATGNEARVIMGFDRLEIKEGSGQYSFLVKWKKQSDSSRWNTSARIPIVVNLEVVKD